MDRAVSLVVTALRDKWPIYIHGDYDVDGITGSALLARFFHKLGRDVACYQPDRLTEGYGLQESFIRAKAPYQGQSALLITVDCGISDISEVKIAKELGFKVIVTDHHIPGDELPPADAIVNPRLEECTFPFPSLAGVGVAFFLAFGIRNSLVEEGELEMEKAPNLKSLMDLVALGTVADVMELTGINRILVRAGLEVMNQPDCAWALALQKQQNNFGGGLFSSETISYRFAPRINAPGRLGQPELSFELLSSDDPHECQELAAQIEALNQQRRDLETGALDQVIAECERQENSGAAAFVVYGPFHQGIIGIIASRAVNRFKKPVIIFTDDSSRLGTVKGSGRSIDSINLYNVLQDCSGSVIQFGGHAMAAGLALHKDNLQFFTNQFESVVSQLDSTKDTDTMIHVDYCLELEEVMNRDFLHHYQSMQPFGNGNPEPVFMLDRPEFVKTGIVKNHLTFSLSAGGRMYRGIGFGMADKIKLIKAGPVHLAFKLKETVYRGEHRTELHVVELIATD
jgi:single-stranded-DNA-specific exonuclease